MSDVPAFDRDPYLDALATRVSASGEDERGVWVELADTIFYPEGGGQPADRGTIDGVPVTDVRKHRDAIRHYIQGPAPSGTVFLKLDWRRRYDHMQQHTGQHLLSAVAEDRFGWKTTAFHLGAELCDIELDVPKLAAAELASLEEHVAEEIRAARPVRVHRLTPEETAALPKLRSRGLPEGHQGPVRLVEIEGVDLATCGGTHLRNTAEIEALALVATESMRGGTRVYFAAGRRLRHRLHAHEARNAALRRILGASDEELATVAQGKLEQLEAVTRELRRCRDELAALLGAQLASQSEPVASVHRQEADLAFLQRLARAFLESRPQGVLLATGGQEGQGVFLLATSRPELRQLGELVASLLEGRGGGGGSVFQGKAARISRRVEARRKLEEFLSPEGGT
ncbi:MAG: alanyl-tRNA editing protein [Thermoanaerobaculum sp.]